ncbi:cytochrome c3 family protein [Dissulfurimicrobium hydrothermale]|uniref:cytochrome c3 family protein n=1 Tax=Dissulfurimicrobium hydrothermale TaxID=1750598 RepID=UPI001ED9ED27|nr:cytochrome c3 family protein [Dissulfurimicrobium hydrothermale]UKL14215.1 cytochrome c family protein [Dissulfurimicrobium hydrothermale]
MNESRSLKFLLIILVLIGLLLLLPGCKKEETNLKFNHKLHVIDNQMACATCHASGEKGKLQNPGMDKCSECHEIDTDHPSEKCLLCHSVKSAAHDYEVSESVPEKPKSYKDLKFSHEYHEGVECNTCHKGIDKQDSLSQIEWPDMFVCKRCHNGKEAPITCEVCHEKIRKDIAPESHHGDWTMHHGLESRFDRSCQFCHENQERFCQDCHRTQKPKDHIFNWKTTQHGEEATHDRRLCTTCHTASYCSDCHRSEQPISHRRADWMALSRENGHAEEARRNFRSCNVCHETSECMKCHQSIILRR